MQVRREHDYQLVNMVLPASQMHLTVNRATQCVLVCGLTTCAHRYPYQIDFFAMASPPAGGPFGHLDLDR